MLAAASGYPQLSGSLIPPMFSQTLIERFYCSSLFGDITNTNYAGELKRCGDQLTFFRAPQVVVRKGVKDGTIKHDTLSTCPITMTVDKFLEFSVKVSKMDIEMICNWSDWESSILKAANNEMMNSIDPELLCSMAVDADGGNKGAKAGVRSGRYNAGAVGAPVLYTSANIMDMLLMAKAILKEQCVPMDDVFIAIPDDALPILEASPRLINNAQFAAAQCNPACDLILNGKLPGKLGGFDVYTSPNICRVADPSTVGGPAGSPAYQIIFGWRGATAFASLVEQTRVVDNDKDSWDVFMQGRMTYGYKVIQSEGIGMIYARFN